MHMNPENIKIGGIVVHVNIAGPVPMSYQCYATIREIYQDVIRLNFK